MERFEDMVRQIPPISRTWIASVVVVSGLTTNNIVPQVKVVFIPNRISEEPWRIFTLFCYFGPLSLALILVLFQIRDSTSALEGGYSNDESILLGQLTAGLDSELIADLKSTFEENRMVDFAYFLFQIATTILVAVTVVYTHFSFTGTSLVFLGPILHNTLLYIWCKTYPQGNLMLLQLPIRAKYAFWTIQLIYMVISDDFLDVIDAYKRGFIQGLHQLLTSQIMVGQVVVVLVAHFWWFMRYFIVENMYNDTKTKTRKDWKEAYEAVAPGTSTRSFVHRAAQVVVTPPWYWFISRKIRGQQRIREIFAREQTRVETNEDVNMAASTDEGTRSNVEEGTGEVIDQGDLHGQADVSGPSNASEAINASEANASEDTNASEETNATENATIL